MLGILSVYKDKIQAGAVSIGSASLMFFNYQIAELSKEIRNVNETMIQVVEKVSYGEKERNNIKTEIEKLADFDQEILKSGILNK